MRAVAASIAVLLLALAAPAGAAQFGAGDPGFTVFQAPQDIPNNNNAGEPTIGVDWKTDHLLFQAFSTTYNIAFDGENGIAWDDALNPTGTLNLDPILFTDRATGRTWGGGLEGPCGNLAYTDDDGGSWKKVSPCSGTVDHETIGAGPWTATPPDGATYPHGVYYCAQFPLADACVTSTDGGATWGSPVPVVGCTSLHGHVKVAPDGTAYLPNAHCAGTVGGGISTDNGRSWGSYTIPGAVSPGRGFDPSVGIGNDNVVYEAWSRADDYHPMIARSTDHGATWDRVTDLSQTVGPAMVASTFQAVVAGDAGRVAVAYLGTQVGQPDVTTTPFDPGFDGVWHLFVSVSYDGGKEFKTVRVTDDPVQRGCIWDRGGTSDCRNLLDFMDAQLARDGRVIVGFADGCTLDCAAPSGTSAQSTAATATVARQSAGRGLLAAGDVQPGTAPPAAAPAAPSAAVNRGPKPCLRVRARRLVAFADARCSSDPDGGVRSVRITWGDRSRPSARAVARHRYRKRGRYRITLTVTDTSGARATLRRRLSVPVRPPRRKPTFGEPDGH